MKTKIPLFLICRIFSDYRKPIYDILSIKYDFTILHTTNKSGINQVTAPYSIKIKSFDFSKKETGTFLFILDYLDIIKPKVVIYEFAVGILSIYTTYLKCKVRNIKFILYSHGYNRKYGFYPQKKWLDKLRLYLMKKADAVIVYGQYDKKIISNYIDSSKIFVAQNTLDTTKLLSIKKQLISEGKSNLKTRLGFKNKFNLVFIGRLLKDKNPNIVIDALYTLISAFKLDIALHYIGDGEQLTFLKEKVENLCLNTFVTFHGSIHDDFRTGEILYASDMMVMPGYLGLSINHAFCFDCPVLSFEKQITGPFHSPEVEYVIHDQTGFLLKEQSSNCIALTLNQYFNQPEKQLIFKENIRNMVSEVFPIEKMIKGFDDAIDYVLRNEHTPNS